MTLNHVVTWSLTTLLLLADMSSLAAAQPSATPLDTYPFRQTISKRMAIVLIVLVCFFIVLAVLSVYTRQCTDHRLPLSGAGAQTHGRTRRAARGLDAAVIATFPTFEYASVKGVKIGKGAVECAVCLSEFEDADELRLLPKCSHVFHSDCIGAWLVGHSTCPVCRASLVPRPGDVSFAALLNSESEGAESVVVGITEEGQNQSHSQSHSQNLIEPLRSRSTGWGLMGLFPRSRSTGNYERFTLRLPEEVRGELGIWDLKRARSCVAFQRMQSSRQGYRGGGSGRRLFWEADGDGGERRFGRLRGDGDGDGQSQ